MLYILLFILINIAGFHTKDIELLLIIIRVEFLFVSIIGYCWCDPANRKAKSVLCLLSIYFSYSLVIDSIFTETSFLRFMIETLIFAMASVFEFSKSYDFKSDEIDKDRVCLVFYRPKTWRQDLLTLFGSSFASFGMIIGDSLYQLKRNELYIQKCSYTKKYIYNNYLLCNTGYSIKNISKKDISILLKQKARQKKTLYVRLNCLRSFRHILNKIKGYEYRGEILPSIYRRRIK